MASKSYKLRDTLRSHSGDVRSVSVGFLRSSDCIISGSRDKTAIIWTENRGKYEPQICLKVHEKYVSAVCWIPPYGQYIDGLVLTGSNDRTVNVFDIGSPNPRSSLFTLTGHNDTVSCIAGYQSGLILTGSWDCTVKLWQESFCLCTMEGHSMAVWAVAFVRTSESGDNFVIASGSADKTIKTWSSEGKAIRTLKGHEDVVRGIVSPRPNEILSCANDATIRHWNVSTGEMLLIYYGHENYIYSIALLGSFGFITSGEDASVRVWELGVPEAQQTVRLPARSIWSVATMRNGDIVAGSSDSQVRIFTCDSNRVANDEAVKAYEVELAAMEHSSKEILQGIKTEDLQNETALLEAGTKDGQTKIIRRDGKVEVYNWSASEMEWKKIGDVVGSTGGDAKTSGKTLYMGREYDYVFNVDFDESKPPIKLPYNMTDDPWHVAQKFLHDNDLPQAYLDTVAQFIIKNAPGAGTTAPVPVSSLADPFTGGTRYVPGGGGSAPASAADPFTGAGRYIPSSNATANGAPQGFGDPFTGGSAYKTAAAQGQASAPVTVNTAYPVREYVLFRQANIDGVLRKLREHFDNEGAELPAECVERFSRAMKPDIDSGFELALDDLNMLGRALEFPEDKIFPALDLLRFAIRLESTVNYFCGQERGVFFLDFLLSLIAPVKSNVNAQLSLKVFANCFASKSGADFMMVSKDKILGAVAESGKVEGDKNVQIGRATVLLNYAVLLNSRFDLASMPHLLYICSEVAKATGAVRDLEALYRFLVALGTIVKSGPEEVKGYAQALDLPVLCSVLASGTTDERVQSVWKSLQSDLK